MPRIITASLCDDLPVLTEGDNWIAWYADAVPGIVEFGGGNTEALAVADLIASHPRGYPDCARTAPVKRRFAELHDRTIAALEAA